MSFSSRSAESTSSSTYTESKREQTIKPAPRLEDLLVLKTNGFTTSDSVFHALFGIFDKTEKSFVCPNVQERREQIAAAIEAELKNESSTVISLITALLSYYITEDKVSIAPWLNEAVEDYKAVKSKQYIQISEAEFSLRLAISKLADSDPFLTNLFAQNTVTPDFAEKSKLEKIKLSIEKVSVIELLEMIRQSGKIELEVKCNRINQLKNENFDFEHTIIKHNLISKYARHLESDWTSITERDLEIIAHICKIRLTLIKTNSLVVIEPKSFATTSHIKIHTNGTKISYFKMLLLADLQTYHQTSVIFSDSEKADQEYKLHKLQKVLKRDNFHHASHSEMASLYFKTGRFADSIERYGIAGVAAMHTLDYKNAEKYLNDALWVIAKLCMFKGSTFSVTDENVAFLKDACVDGSFQQVMSADILYTLALLREFTKDTDAAERYFRYSALFSTELAAIFERVTDKYLDSFSRNQNPVTKIWKYFTNEAQRQPWNRTGLTSPIFEWMLKQNTLPLFRKRLDIPRIHLSSDSQDGPMVSLSSSATLAVAPSASASSSTSDVIAKIADKCMDEKIFSGMPDDAIFCDLGDISFLKADSCTHPSLFQDLPVIHSSSSSSSHSAAARPFDTPSAPCVIPSRTSSTLFQRTATPTVHPYYNPTSSSTRPPQTSSSISSAAFGLSSEQCATSFSGGGGSLSIDTVSEKAARKNKRKTPSSPDIDPSTSDEQLTFSKGQR